MQKLWLKIWLWWTRKRHPDLEYFSDASKVCFAQANQLAGQQGSTYINSVHLTLAILQTPLNQKIDPSGQIVAALEQMDDAQHTSHSELAKKAIEYAIEHARKQEQQEITPLLLLYGISQVKSAQGAIALESHGVTSEKIAALITEG